MLFYVKANVTLRIQGISGPFIQMVSWLVNADNHIQAKIKYEEQVRRDFAHMNFSGISFEYLEVAGEIK